MFLVLTVIREILTLLTILHLEIATAFLPPANSPQIDIDDDSMCETRDKYRAKKTLDALSGTPKKYRKLAKCENT